MPPLPPTPPPSPSALCVRMRACPLPSLSLSLYAPPMYTLTALLIALTATLCPSHTAPSAPTPTACHLTGYSTAAPDAYMREAYAPTVANVTVCSVTY
jgi:hypothetical protein